MDAEDILSCWNWKIEDMKALALVSVMGDLFFVGSDNAIYWLQTDQGELTRVGDNIHQFEQDLRNEEKVNNWFLPLLVAELIAAGKTLKENEVYSYLKLPVIGGEYSIDNIQPTDMSVHFAFSGQICEQIKDLPNGTNIEIEVKWSKSYNNDF